MKTLLRPSVLPKIAECAFYESKPFAGEAAERGTKMDEAFRQVMDGTISCNQLGDKLCAEDAKAVLWAVDTIKVLCGDEVVIVDKYSCKLEPWREGLTGGEFDAFCPELGKLFDLKSGQVRNYEEQQAAYAVSLMDAYFLDEVDSYLLFCDQQELVLRKFTYEEAMALVNGVVESFESRKEPSPCEYCSWCARAEACPARVGLVKSAVEAVDIPSVDLWFEKISADPEQLADFLDKAKVVEDFQEKAKAKALEYINNSVAVPGYARSFRRGREAVPPDMVGCYIQQMGFGPVLAAYGELGADKFRTLWRDKMGDAPFPEECVKVGAGSSFVKRTRRKK